MIPTNKATERLKEIEEELNHYNTLTPSKVIGFCIAQLFAEKQGILLGLGEAKDKLSEFSRRVDETYDIREGIEFETSFISKKDVKRIAKEVFGENK
mgnify:CR=1 FL=1